MIPTFAFPLSCSQERLWFLEQLEPRNPAYNIFGALRLRGPLNLHAFEESVNEIVQRQESLRTAFFMEGGRPFQTIKLHERFALRLDDLRDLPPSERSERARALAEEEARRPFDLRCDDLFRARLFRLGDDDHLAVFSMHHIISDGWSSGIFVRELVALYEDFSLGRGPSLPPLPIQYTDFASWQREWLRGDRLSGQLAYWKKQLAPPLAPLDLPTDRPRPAIEGFEGGRERFSLDATVSSRLLELVASEGSTLFMGLFAAFAVLLHEYTGRRDILVGTPIAGRRQVELEGLIGFFVNTLVLRVDLGGDPSFLEILSRAREVATEAYDHQDSPFERLVEVLQPERSLGHNPLFQVMFALQNQPEAAGARLRGLEVEAVELEGGTSKRDLTLHMRAADRRITGHFEYNVALFDKVTIERLVTHFQVVLGIVTAAPERRLSEISPLTEAERRRLVIEWSGLEASTAAPRGSLPVHRDFERWAERAPDSIAVAYEGSTLTYRELNQKANQVAHRLRGCGVGAETIVALHLDRSLEAIVALLGVLKAGAAYLPLDPKSPTARSAEILRDSGARVLLYRASLTPELPRTELDAAISIDGSWAWLDGEPTVNLRIGPAAHDLAYVIYTSGSTGRPKGVTVEHRHLRSYVDGVVERLGFVAETSFALVSTLAADLGNTVLFPSLVSGACLHVISEERAFSASAMADYFERHRIDVLKIVPSHLKALLDTLSTGRLLPRRMLVLGGEASSFEWVKQLQRLAPRCVLVNHYGPTEATVGVLTHEVRSDEERAGPITPLGRPLPGAQVYVLDEHRSPLPIGVRGELYIGGASVARGYLNHPELTAHQFLPNPFDPTPGARLYRTGDMARYLPDGVLEFLGRADDQLKIRGFRIEPREVQAVLAESPCVGDVVVTATDDEHGGRRLIAYVKPDLARLASGDVGEHDDLNTEQVESWRAVFAGTYGGAFVGGGGSSTVGWNSSYDGRPIPEHEIREQVEHTSRRVVSLAPTRVLEVGCGAGLLLFQIAPSVARYCATDFSREALAGLDQAMKASPHGLPQVELLHRTADDFSGFQRGEFDLVLLNSVIQYFPDVDYLARVLRDATLRVREGGRVFIGDVRSLPLLEAFHATVQARRASTSLTLGALRRRTKEHAQRDRELVLDPGFFVAIAERLPGVGGVEIQLKRGVGANELTCFRYDVLLHVGRGPDSIEHVTWLDWERERLTPPRVEDILRDQRPTVLGIAGVANARLAEGRRILRWIEGRPDAETVHRAREAASDDDGALDPEEFWGLAERLPYDVSITWSACDPFRYDVFFARKGDDPIVGWGGVVHRAGQPEATDRPLRAYANIPGRERLERRLGARLRDLARRKLPEPMVPSYFMFVDAFPLTPNGKLDRARLPAPDGKRPATDVEYTAPRDRFELELVSVWEDVLDVRPVGVTDDFFALGGHSLLAVLLIAETERRCGFKIPLTALFQASTVEKLAALARRADAPAAGSSIVRFGGVDSGPPFFCVHPVGGNVLCYHVLARQLGARQTLHGIQARGLHGEAPPATRIEEMVERYVALVREAQPRGPYRLGGWSMGGVVALEMARALTRAGHEVERLILIDTAAPEEPERVSRPALLRRFASNLGALFGKRIEVQPRIHDELSWDDQLDQLLEQARAASALPCGADVGQLRALVEVFLANTEATSGFVPEIYPGKISLLRARDPRPGARDPLLGWGRFASRPIDVHHVDGDHYSMFAEPDVRSLAEQLCQALRGEAPGDP